MAPPLNRTWYNALVDDDGSGSVGTVWNKTQVDGLMDTIDASLAPLVSSPHNGSLQFSVDATISRNTADGADNGALVLAGGGTWGTARGGMITVAGNEHASTGQVIVQPGDVAGSGVIVMDRAARHAIFVRGDTGLVQLPIGQLWFPGTQNPSTDPQVLDDYREGTWTPILTASAYSGQSYSAQSGMFLKFGRNVVVAGSLTLSVVGSFSGNLNIGGLPIAVANGQPGHVGITYWSGLALGWSSLWGVPTAPTSAQLFGSNGPTTTAAPMTASSLAAGMLLIFGGWYISAQ